MLTICLIIQPLYFNEVCFTSGICFVTQCKSLSISGWDKWLWSRWGWQCCGLVDASQAGHAGNTVVTHALCHSGQANLCFHPSTALKAADQSVWREPHADPTSGNAATGALFMVILNMQQSFSNIRVINITVPSDLESASMLLTFTGRDKMLNYLCFDYEQI